MRACMLVQRNDITVLGVQNKLGGASPVLVYLSSVGGVGSGTNVSFS